MDLSPIAFHRLSTTGKTDRLRRIQSRVSKVETFMVFDFYEEWSSCPLVVFTYLSVYLLKHFVINKNICKDMKLDTKLKGEMCRQNFRLDVLHLKIFFLICDKTSSGYKV